MEITGLILSIIVLGVFACRLLRLIYYWHNKGVPSASMVPFLGSYASLLAKRLSFSGFQKHIYDVNGAAKYIGMMDFHTPAILVKDPELIKLLGVKNFSDCPDHKRMIGASTDSLFGNMLFFLTGRCWKQLRVVMSTAMTSSNIKIMSHTVSEITTEFSTYLKQHPEHTKSIGMKDIFKRIAAETIAMVMFGTKIDCVKNKRNEFYEWALSVTNIGSVFAFLKYVLFRGVPLLTQWLGLSIISSKSVKFFKNLIVDNMNNRKNSQLDKPDFIQLFLEARAKKTELQISLDDLMTQLYNLVFGGFDTSSTLMCFASYELAVNPKIQSRLRLEIDQCLRDGNGFISYESLNSLKYLDAVVCETLRKYPPLPWTDRVCRRTYQLPEAVPGGQPVTLEPNMVIFFPIYAIQNDPKHFEDPEKFDPERFSDENKVKISPYTYIPFGVGPRMCPGQRYAVMTTKIILADLVAKFILKPTSGTTIPLKFAKGTPGLSIEGELCLELTPRET